MHSSSEDSRGREEGGDVKQRKLSDATKTLLKDKRYSYAMKSDTPEDEFEAEELEKALSRSVMQRQAEAKRERTDAMLQKYHEKELELKKRRLLYRFRAMVRIMMMASSLRNYGSEYFDRMQGIDRTTPEVQSALPAFDLSLYRVQKEMQVPSQVKRMMAKPRWLRTEEELAIIFRTLCQLSSFAKYPRATLRNMAPVIQYSYIEANRVVLRQGHMPVCFYFVLSGSLLVYIDVKDHMGIPKSRLVGKMGSGASFGELALLHNTPRTATVTTEFSSELLSVEKHDFELLIKDVAQHKWLGLYNAITLLAEFSSWTKEQREHCSNNCKMIKYENNKVIIGNIQGNPEHLYFIVDGRCRVVESLRLLATSSKSSGALTISPLHESIRSREALSNQSAWSSVVRRYLHIMTLEKGQYFGIGEDLHFRYVVSWGPVECLQIAHSYLLRSGHADWVELLQDRMLSLFPSHKYVFNEFVERATWRAYKKGLMADLVKRTKKSTVATMADVPRSIRQEEEVENWNTIQMY